jgi:hypothetical protein
VESAKPPEQPVVKVQIACKHPSGAIAFSEDEYQACSGIGHGADKKTVVVDRKDPAGAKAHLYFEAFCGTTEVVPCYKATTHRFLLQDCLSKHDIHLSEWV